MLLSAEQIKSAMADLNKPPLPAIEYLTTITAIGEYPNKAGNGKYLRVEHTISSPPEYKGERIMNFITTEHPNPKATSMGQLALAKLALACGFICLDKADDLLLAQVVLQAKHEERDNKVYVKVKGYRPPMKPKEPASDPVKDAWVANGGVVTPNPVTHPQNYSYNKNTPLIDDAIPF